MGSTMDWEAELSHWLDAEEWLNLDSSAFPGHLIARAATRLPDNLEEMDEDAIVREFYDALAAVLDCDEWGHLAGDEVGRLIRDAAAA